LVKTPRGKKKISSSPEKENAEGGETSTFIKGQSLTQAEGPPPQGVNDKAA